MSVCFSLYKVHPDVDYLGAPFNHASKDELSKMDKLFDKIHNPDEFGVISDDEDKALDEFYAEAFSDGKEHEFLMLNFFTSLGRTKIRGKKRFERKISSLNVKSLQTVQGFTYKYVTVDEVLYRQGWFLKRAFFRKKDTVYVGTTKKQMMDFFDRYLDVKDERGIECYRAFMNAWEDGYVFYVSF